ncbi:hypothetical protein ANN_20190 [Periplaneta americana]|uniref:Uncharacterized protein n=1 Tax=Periplaneta americana TaxID=6978 RepID=A0ABQ8SBY6_PERAM|nr:hypothetical protein ANN_20190 [Periplaneta americana]
MSASKSYTAVFEPFKYWQDHELELLDFGELQAPSIKKSKLGDLRDLIKFLSTKEREWYHRNIFISSTQNDATEHDDIYIDSGSDYQDEHLQYLNILVFTRLRVFENKVLRKIFEAKRDEVTGERRKLHNAELHALYSSPDIIRNIISRRLRWAGHVARMGESRNTYRVLVGRSEGKRPLGRPRRRWEDNIKMDLRDVGYDCRDWITGLFPISDNEFE